VPGSGGSGVSDDGVVMAFAAGAAALSEEAYLPISQYTMIMVIIATVP
jgi:hypothetical protein